MMATIASCGSATIKAGAARTVVRPVRTYKATLGAAETRTWVTVTVTPIRANTQTATSGTRCCHPSSTFPLIAVEVAAITT
jgi:hypothetical protein